MDKYAIDIDKILNDFEFNELLVSNTIAETIATRVTVAPSLKQTEVDVNTPIVPVSNKPDVVPTNDDGEPDEQRIQNSCSDATADNKGIGVVNSKSLRFLVQLEANQKSFE